MLRSVGQSAARVTGGGHWGWGSMWGADSEGYGRDVQSGCAQDALPGVGRIWEVRDVVLERTRWRARGSAQRGHP